MEKDALWSWELYFLNLPFRPRIQPKKSTATKGWYDKRSAFLASKKKADRGAGKSSKETYRGGATTGGGPSGK